MAWSVEWSGPDQAAAQRSHGTPNIYICMQGRGEAFQTAKQYLHNGFTVWSIKDDSGAVVLDQDGVWRHFNSGDGPITSGG